MKLDQYPIIIVGAGFYGLTIAEHIARELKIKVAVLEKRSHIGGNAYSYPDEKTGIEIHKYGSHIFHTSREDVWNYVNKFATFNSYRHSVWARHLNKNYSLPINLLTLEQFYGRSFSPREAETFFESFAIGKTEENLEEKAISSVGPQLYEAFIRGYTSKQWGIDPKFLPPETISRLPVRSNLNNRYFNDRFEGIPEDGYGKLFEKMVDTDLIDIFLEADYFAHSSSLDSKQITVYTGPIDRFFDFKFGVLGWRTLDFEIETLNVSDFQGTSVINYPSIDARFTRIHEFKHFTPERHKDLEQTVIMREYSRFASQNDDPYYPINTPEDREKLDLYRSAQSECHNVFFGGRLGSYKYLDMHMAIASAFTFYETTLKPKLTKAN